MFKHELLVTFSLILSLISPQALASLKSSPESPEIQNSKSHCSESLKEQLSFKEAFPDLFNDLTELYLKMVQSPSQPVLTPQNFLLATLKMDLEKKLGPPKAQALLNEVQRYVVSNANKNYVTAASADPIREEPKAPVHILEIIPRSEFPFNGTNASIANFINDSSLIVGYENGFIEIFDLQSGRVEQRIKTHNQPLNSLKVSPDQKQIIAGFGDGSLKTWDLKHGVFKGSLHPQKGISSFKWAQVKDFSPNGKLLATASGANSNNNLVRFQAQVLNLKTGNIVFSSTNKLTPYSNFKFSEDGKYLSLSEIDRTTIFDTETFEPIRRIPGSSGSRLTKGPHPMIVTKAALPQSKNLALFVWDLDKNKPRHILTDQWGPLEFAVSNDGTLVAAISQNIHHSSVSLWETNTGTLIANLKGHREALRGLSFSSDNRFLVTFGKDSVAKIWEATTGRFLGDVRGHTSSLTHATFSPNSETLVTVGTDRRILIWNLNELSEADLLKFTQAPQ